MVLIQQMEAHHSAGKFAEQLQIEQNDPTATTQVSQSTHSSAREGLPIIYPPMDASSVLQVPTSRNSASEGARWSARGEPAILNPRPVQESTLSTCQHIVSLLGQITEFHGGLMRELRMMRRDMRLMKREQRRANARMVSVVHSIKELKEQFEQQ